MNNKIILAIIIPKLWKIIFNLVYSLHLIFWKAEERKQLFQIGYKEHKPKFKQCAHIIQKRKIMRV